MEPSPQAAFALPTVPGGDCSPAHGRNGQLQGAPPSVQSLGSGGGATASLRQMVQGAVTLGAASILCAGVGQRKRQRQLRGQAKKQHAVVIVRRATGAGTPLPPGINWPEGAPKQDQEEQELTAYAPSVAPAADAGTRRPRVAVVGAGWGGLGAAKALCENGCEVFLIDGTDNPASEPKPTPSGKPYEPGTRGFWRDYPNINKSLTEIGVKEDEVFTNFTESAFYSPDGLEATAPVFGDAPELPSPLGQVFASFERFRRLPVADRVSISGLLMAMLEFDRDEKTLAKYDRMTAHELFIRCGLSRRLVDDFLKPTLLVGLFKPPEELSAAVTMELLYFYALAHQTSFDVRWLKKGTVGGTLMKPILERIVADYGVDVRAGTFVQSLKMTDGRITGLACRKKGSVPMSGEKVELDNLDGCVLALGAGGMRAVMQGSPKVALRCPTLAAAGALRGVDVISVRLWLNGFVDTLTPANVLANFQGLRGAGGTFFMLDQLQPDHSALWGGEEVQGSVVACDFYNAGALLPLESDDIVDLLINQLLPGAVPAFKDVAVVDSYVGKYPGGVSWFSPGSFTSRPTLETNVPNLVCAGDWVRLGEREHGAKGLCQERAFVTGFEAANSLARRGQLGNAHRKQHKVIPIRDDELQVMLGKKGFSIFGSAMDALGLESPWVR